MELEYEDFVVVIASLDAGWSRARPTPEKSYEEAVWDQVALTHERLDDSARDYVRDLALNHESWLAAYEADGREVSDDQKKPVDERLFAVQTWSPFGHLDNLSLLAVDDLDSATVAIERYDLTVEEVTTAFCPKMSLYRKPSDDEKKRYAKVREGEVRPDLTLYEHDHEIFFDFLKTCPTRRQPQDYKQGTEFQKAHPLSIFTRVRLFPTLTLGRALVVQEAIYRLFAHAIRNAVAQLKQDVVTGPNAPYNETELQNIAVTFFDLQDEEEVGLMIAGSNYTIITTLIAALQNLTIQDLAFYEPEATYSLFSCRAVRKLFEIKALPNDSERGDSDEEKDAWLEEQKDWIAKHLASVEDSHLLRWARSLANTSPHLVAAKELEVVPGGCVRLRTMIGIMPGHNDVIGALLKSMDRRREPVPVLNSADHTLRTFGVHDLVVDWEQAVEGADDDPEPEPEPLEKLISINDAIHLWPNMIGAIQTSSDGGIRRDFTAWSTMVSVPVSRSFCVGIGQSHRMPLHEKMGEFKNIQSFACLNADAVRDKTREMGFPVASRRPLIFLCQNFSQAIQNPLNFDVVVDFLDFIETLMHALTVEVPDATEELWKFSPAHFQYRASQDLVDQLNMLLAAIDDALELRLRRIYPEDPVRDWSLDLRSQNHQLLLSADAVLKCATAIFRKDVLGLHDERDSQSEEAKEIRRHLGVLLRLKFDAGMKTRDFPAFRRHDTSGSLDTPIYDGTRLAVFEADFPHLRSALRYADFYHESFHLIFEEIMLSDQRVFTIEEMRKFTGVAPDADLREAYHEIFVHFSMLLFIYDGNRDLQLCDFLEGLSQNTSLMQARLKTPIKESELRSERIEQFAWHVFHVLGPVLWLEHALDIDLENESISAIDLCRATGRTLPKYSREPVSQFSTKLLKRVKQYAGAFPDYEWVFGEEQGEVELFDDFVSHIGSYYAETSLHFESFWQSARAIFMAHVSRVAKESDPDSNEKPTSCSDCSLPLDQSLIPEQVSEEDVFCYEDHQRRIDEEIRNTWAGDGKSARYRALNGRIPEVCKLGGAIDANLIVRRSLYHYLAQYRHLDEDEKDLVKALPRLRETVEGDDTKRAGFIDRDELEKRPHAPFLLDRTSVNHFSCVPEARRRRVGQDIAVLKTMWGVSSRNRARRLVSLLDAASPKR